MRTTMKGLLLFLFIVVFQNTLSGQSEREVNIIMHDVKPGETIRMISKKYLVSPSDIYELNKFALDGIAQGMVLQIPLKNSPQRTAQSTSGKAPEPATPAIVNVADASEVEAIMDSLEGTPEEGNSTPGRVSAERSHKVAPGETLSAISRKYGIPVARLQSHNRKLLENGLKAGQVIMIPGTGSQHDLDPESAPSAHSNPVDHRNVTHIVEAKETLYSISKKYNVSVEEIKRQNEQLLAHGLQAGQVIKIKPNN